MTFIWMKQALTSAEVVLPDVDSRWVAMHFVAFRFLIGTVSTLVILRASRSGFKDPEVWKGGFSLGLILILGFLIQMVGLTDVTPAVSAFLTSLYVVFTAIMGVALGRQRMTSFMIFGVLLATFGAGWISGPPRVEFGVGEWLTVISGFLFAMHIIVTDRVTRLVDPIQSTGTMMITVMVLAFGILVLDPLGYGGVGWFSNAVELMRSMDYVIPLALCGFFGSFVALAALMRYQKEITPVRAALVYAFEPVWAAVVSLILGLEGDPSTWLFIGAGALLMGNLIIELEPREIV
jgi:drug/metabolite transporter (DMT)-like permease|tara:strand:- start:3513 stop:4388 length:876 start_codon:yes stop_codon:yes gene_type:complete